MGKRRTAEERARNPSRVTYDAPELCRSCEPLLTREQGMHAEAFGAVATALDQKLAECGVLEARLTHAEIAAAILRASGECPPAMAQLNEENWQLWTAWLRADRTLTAR